jgi:hypothetical protein
LLGGLFALFKLALLFGVTHIFSFASDEDDPTVFLDLLSQRFKKKLLTIKTIDGKIGNT